VLNKIDDLNREVLYKLNNKDLISITNYYYKSLCDTDPILKKRIKKEINYKIL
jgi:hypothetical protein